MQASIRNRQLKEFSYAQVLDWKALPSEKIKGDLFQAGILTYKTETIFGVKNIQAKAFIKDRVVTRWVWAKSGMEIK